MLIIYPRPKTTDDLWKLYNCASPDWLTGPKVWACSAHTTIYPSPVRLNSKNSCFCDATPVELDPHQIVRQKQFPEMFERLLKA